jgi:hypothetical protein
VPGGSLRGLAAGCAAVALAGSLACAATGGGAAGAPDPPAPPAATRGDRAPGEYLVTLREGGDEAALRRALARHALREVEALGRGRFLVRLADDPGLDALRRDALASGEVVDVQPNFAYRKAPRR